jgi:hypothetical protein
MEQNNKKKDNALTKSLSLVVEKSPTHGLMIDESKENKLGTHSYNFLATLRKVKRLNTENIQKMYKAYNMVQFLAYLRHPCPTVSSITDYDCQN